MKYENMVREILEKNSKQLEKDIEVLMNQYNIDTMTDTPDFILASYLMTCLRNYMITKTDTEEWFGKRITINGVEEVNYDKDKNYKRW